MTMTMTISGSRCSEADVRGHFDPKRGLGILTNDMPVILRVISTFFDLIGRDEAVRAAPACIALAFASSAESTDAPIAVLVGSAGGTSVRDRIGINTREPCASLILFKQSQ